MYKYGLALKPVVLAGGTEQLDEGKKAMFDALLAMMGKFLESTPEIDSTEILEDLTMVITANQDVWDTISGKLGQNAIVSKL